MSVITPVLLCGGVGSRLWRVSRRGRAKQYLNLIGEQWGSYLSEDDIVRFEDVYGRSLN